MMDDMEQDELLRERLACAAVLTDFDGTLAPIVDDPAAARPAPGAISVLLDLAERAPVVGVISGRPVDFLVRHLPDERLHLAGLYGFERRDLGEVVDHVEAARWVEPVRAAAEELDEHVPEGVVVEAKRLSITLHYRRCPERAAEVQTIAERVAAAHGLTTRRARKAVEVHPDHSPDKGMVVEELAAECEAACFVGDDVGDLAAFDALDRLADAGLVTVRVAVVSDESDPELVERADVRVDGSEGAVAWLASLLEPAHRLTPRR